MSDLLTESFIDGAAVSSAETYPNIDPSTGATLGDVARAGGNEIDQAVTAARRASRGWRATTPEQRSDLLSALAGLIDREVETLARLESEDSGKPLSQARNDARVCARYFRFYSRVIESYYGLSIPLRPDLHVYTRREPLGVTGNIVAWNYPMQLFGRGVAPAIATGNCAVLKPADETPRTAVYLARLAAEAGLPAGVINVVTGLGPEAGAALAAHPGIDHLSFVGSTEVGSLIAGAAARRVAPVTLELGGKSAHLVFGDADMERAATVIANAILQNAGQTCSAGSRVLVDERVHDELLQRIADRFATVSIGPGITDPDLGPLVSRKQQDRVRGYVESARKPGSRHRLRRHRRRARRHHRRRLFHPHAHRRRRSGGEDRPRGDLRPGPHRHHLRSRGRGGRAGQRHRLRPDGRGLDDGPGAGAPGGGAGRRRADLREHLRRRRRRGAAVRRVPQVGLRAREGR